jgi:hypothetical protein
MRFFRPATALVLAASVALTACTGGTSAIPRATQTPQSTGALPRDGAAQCRAALPGGAICGNSAIRLPVGTEPSADGGVVATGTHDPIFMSVRTGKLLVRSSGVLMSAEEIGNTLALQNPPTNLIYGGQIQPGTEMYIGIVGPQSYAPDGGGVIQFFVKSGQIVGNRNVPIP